MTNEYFYRFTKLSRQFSLQFFGRNLHWRRWRTYDFLATNPLYLTFPNFLRNIDSVYRFYKSVSKKLAMLSILILPYQCTAKYRGHKAVPDPTRVCNFCDVPSLDCCAKWIESRIPSWPLSTRTWQAEAQHPLLFPVGSPSISSPAALVEVQPVAFRLICKTKQTKCWETWIGVELSSSLCNVQPNHRDQQQFSSRVWLIQSSCLKSATRKIKN